MSCWSSTRCSSFAISRSRREAQARFAAHFGSLHIHPIYPVLPELPEIMLIDTHAAFLPDNDNWHTDVTFSQDAAARRHSGGEAPAERGRRYALVQ